MTRVFGHLAFIVVLATGSVSVSVGLGLLLILVGTIRP